MLSVLLSKPHTEETCAPLPEQGGTGGQQGVVWPPSFLGKAHGSREALLAIAENLQV